MPKQVTSIWKHFRKETRNGKVYSHCHYCKKQYFNNATRMAKHIQDCVKCPNSVKTSLAQFVPNSRSKHKHLPQLQLQSESDSDLNQHHDMEINEQSQYTPAESAQNQSSSNINTQPEHPSQIKPSTSASKFSDRTITSMAFIDSISEKNRQRLMKH